MEARAIRQKDPRAEEAFRRWDELRAHRAHFEQDWESIARLLRPQRGGFGLTDGQDRKMEKPLSSAPILALTNFAAGMYGNVSNEANQWYGIATPDEDFNNWQPMAEWLDIATRRTRNSLLPSLSPFYTATGSLYADIAAFGNAAAYDELSADRRGFIDVTLSLAEVVFDIDPWGQVCEVVRRFLLTARQAVMMFPGRDVLPPKVLELAAKGAPDRLVFAHHVLPNGDWRRGALGPRGKKWLSRHVCETDMTLLREGGYDDMPFYAPRWEVDAGMIYGTGPGFTALASTRLLTRMHEATARASQWAADPTHLAPDRDAWALNGRFAPGQVIYGGTDARGNALVQPYAPVGNIGVTLQEKQALLEEIKDAFHFSLMTLAGRTGMTATEVMAIEEERMRLWAPHASRIQQEYLARKIERRFKLMWKAGQIPPPPPEAQAMELPLQVTYTSAAAMAVKAREGLAVGQFLANLAGLAQLGPEHMQRVADRLDPDAAIDVLHDASASVPAKILRPREAADQLAAQRQQAQEAMMALQAAQAAGTAMRDMGQGAAAFGQAQAQGQEGAA